MNKLIRQLIFIVFVAISLNGISQETLALKNELYRAIEENRLSDVKKIVESGYDINQVFKLELDYSFHGLTPLLAACETKNEEIANYLIQKGANVNVKPDLPDSKEYLNLYPIDFAIINQMQSTINLLLENKAELNYLMPNGCEFGGLSPLHVAIIQCNFNMAMQLVANGADVNLKTSKKSEYDETTALHILARCREPNLELASLMLKNGAKVNCRDSWGATPLHVAVELRAAVSYISFLLNNGASAEMKNKENQTAYEIAKSNNYTKLLELLKTE